MKNNIYIIFFLTIIILTGGFLISKKQIGKSTNSIQNTKPIFPDPDSLSFIEQLRQRQFTGGEITIEETLGKESNYTSFIFSYPSDSLKIYGMMNIPDGDPPAGGFPLVLLNHGYFNQSSFSSGDGTHGMADILAANGYLTLASDYRGFGKSENDDQGSRGHRPEYAIDVLNLIASIPTIDKASPEKIGIWGHSMGGEVALRAAEATDKLKAIVLWAPTSARVSDNARFYGGRQSRPTQASSNLDLKGSSPADYLHYITSPISLHQGLSDTEVNPDWSKELNEALLKEDKTIEFFEYPGQDHNFRNLGWDVISKRTVDFFDRYLK